MYFLDQKPYFKTVCRRRSREMNLAHTENAVEENDRV
jgi:hypothetical protein